MKKEVESQYSSEQNMSSAN